MLIIGGLLLIIVPLSSVFLLATRREDRTSVAGLMRSDREPNGPYIGSRACGECHPGQYALYCRSGHARTLRAAATGPLARKLAGRVVADPERPDVTWKYDLRDDRLLVERTEGGATERLLLDYALGSGHHATTFVSVGETTKVPAFEHRITYYAEGDALAITPGQTSARPAAGTTARGRELTPQETVKCFGCHSTQLSAEGAGRLDASMIIPNVSCERCHGPGRAHVAAARAGREVAAMPFGTDQWTAESQLWLCGQCHRHPAKAGPGRFRPEDPDLVRFQPVGLMQSRCYTQSGGTLSCVTCHDPHARASTDRSVYEAACLKCHEASPQAHCPISPRGDCIDCHMPKADSGQRILFTDHWIRVRKPGGEAREIPHEGD